MRPVYPVLLLVTFIVAGIAWYQQTAAMCPVPITYELGRYDERFLLPREEVVAVLKEAETAWEEATGRDLFTYSTDPDVTVDFIFDARQAEALSEEKLRAALDQKELASNETLLTIAELNKEYEDLKSRYERRVAAYDARLERHNARVAEVNNQGGAQPEEFEALSQEGEVLRKEGQALEAMTDDLNELIERINSVGAYGNQLIDEYNAGVERYNERFAEAGAFTQGEYVGERINVYKYTNRTELLQVLAHEFGHALGIDHVEGVTSIMYYLLEEQPSNLTLAPEDVAAFVAVCGETESWSQAVRRVIRASLAVIT